MKEPTFQIRAKLAHDDRTHRQRSWTTGLRSFQIMCTLRRLGRLFAVVQHYHIRTHTRTVHFFSDGTHESSFIPVSESACPGCPFPCVPNINISTTVHKRIWYVFSFVHFCAAICTRALASSDAAAGYSDRCVCFELPGILKLCGCSALPIHDIFYTLRYRPHSGWPSIPSISSFFIHSQFNCHH